MAVILNIETSSNLCSIAIARNGELLVFKEDRQGNSHARLLTVLISEAMSEQNLSFNDLSAIAISEGPGSYTGLRIGVAAAKGLCYALNKPLIAVPTLFALAQGMLGKMGKTETNFIPVVDAGRDEIYAAVYDSKGDEVLYTTTFSLNEHFENMIVSYGNVAIGGPAAIKCKEQLPQLKAGFIENVECDARLMVKISEKKFRNGDFENLALFEPRYLKEFIPKIKKAS